METVVNFLNTINTELFTGINAVVLIILLLMMLRAFGVAGLQAYVYLALSVANIQVMRGANFSFFDDPVPLGTLTYGTVSIALSIMTELYGIEIAKKTIWIGMFFMAAFTISMVLTMGYAPLKVNGMPDSLMFLYDNQFIIKKLFLPMPSIFIASSVAYFFSERCLVYVQNMLEKIVKSIQIRSYSANMIASLVDLFLMNFLAWVVLNPNPITMRQLFISYIFASYPFRLFTALVAIPAIKVALKISTNSDGFIKR